MTNVKTTTRATRTSTPSTPARTAVATLLVLAAPAVWLVIGLAITIAGASLGHHTHLTEWGIALMAAVLAGAAVGLPLAARR